MGDWVEYELLVFKEIRKHHSRLSTMSDDKLARLYSEWSGITASAGWLVCSPKGVKAFIEWATTAPCDMEEGMRYIANTPDVALVSD